MTDFNSRLRKETNSVQDLFDVMRRYFNSRLRKETNEMPQVAALLFDFHFNSRLSEETNINRGILGFVVFTFQLTSP